MSFISRNSEILYFYNEDSIISVLKLRNVDFEWQRKAKLSTTYKSPYNILNTSLISRSSREELDFIGLMHKNVLCSDSTAILLAAPQTIFTHCSLPFRRQMGQQNEQHKICSNIDHVIDLGCCGPIMQPSCVEVPFILGLLSFKMLFF